MLITLEADAHDVALLQGAVQALIAEDGVTDTDLEALGVLRERIDKAALAATERARAGSPHPPTVRVAIETVVLTYKSARFSRRPLTPYMLAATTLAVYLSGGNVDEPKPSSLILPPDNR